MGHIPGDGSKLDRLACMLEENRLNSLFRWMSRYLGADIIVFNTGRALCISQKQRQRKLKPTSHLLMSCSIHSVKYKPRWRLCCAVSVSRFVPLDKCHLDLVVLQFPLMTNHQFTFDSCRHHRELIHCVVFFSSIEAEHGYASVLPYSSDFARKKTKASPISRKAQNNR